MKRLALLIAMTLATAVHAETPGEGAAEILKLLKAKDYVTLFKTRYTEWHKVEAQGVKPEAAIKKLSHRWDKNHAMMVSLFEQLSKATFTSSKSKIFQKSETGDVATATVSLGKKKIPYKLHKMTNGTWGFRM